MVFIAINSSEIASGKPVSNSLLTKIKNNFDDLDGRAEGTETVIVDTDNTITARNTTLIQFGDTSGGDFTSTLPAAADMLNKTVIFKKITNDGYTWTIDGAASDTIEGQLTQILTTQNQVLYIVSDGSAWWKISDIDASGAVPNSRTINTTAPLTGGGNFTTDRTISIPMATAAVDGYLSAADFATFAATAPSTLTDGYIWIGDITNTLAEQQLSGDVTMDRDGVVAISSGVIVNADVNASAAIAYSKLNLTGGILNADINASAAIARSKIAIGAPYHIILNDSGGALTSSATLDRALVAAGTASHVIINDGSGNLSSEAQLAITRGGTGAATATGGFDALSPMTSVGDMIIGGAAGTRTRLAGNTSTTKKVLTQQGTGSGSASPVWNQIDDTGYFASGAEADATHRGVLSTGAQNIAGVKNFSDGIKVNGGTTVLNTFGAASFTPTISSSGTTPTGVTYARQVGYYFFVGPICYFHFHIQWTGVGNSPTGDLLISLPSPIPVLNSLTNLKATVNVIGGGITPVSGYQETMVGTIDAGSKDIRLLSTKLTTGVSEFTAVQAATNHTGTVYGSGFIIP